jgi:hypothetical protein
VTGAVLRRARDAETIAAGLRDEVRELRESNVILASLLDAERERGEALERRLQAAEPRRR